MIALQLQIPPLPQFITVGHSIWRAGEIHFRREFQVFDVLFILKGTLFMTEEDIPYEIKAGSILLLEAGRTHWGHQTCTEDTEIYWVHFIHPLPCFKVDSKQISSSTIIKKGTDFDTAPSEQFMFLPKFIHTEMNKFIPTLQSMVALHQKSNLLGALPLNSLLAHLLTLLQNTIIEGSAPSLSSQHSKRMEIYLNEHLLHSHNSQQIEAELQLNFDYLARCLKKHTGMSPMQYIHYQRIERAKALLLQSNDAVPYIAEQVGIMDYNYFIRLFKIQTGLTPGVFRQTKQSYV
jgi:AraC-like DNA-binding protein